MKTIIEGKTYNTETATKLGDVSRGSGCGPGDFNYDNTDLYITKKGTFFIAGEGGALSQWSRSCGNGSCGGSGIRLVDKTDARDLFERHDLENYADYFPVEEG
jgi:hypothetical protein